MPAEAHHHEGGRAALRDPVYATVDLSTGRTGEYRVSHAYFKKYIGGKTLGARLLLDLTAPGFDPLSPEAVIIINTGPLNGTGAPSSSRFNMTFKNVMTGGIASSNCGGTFGVMMRKAGFEGLIVSGKAEKPTTIELLDGSVRLLDATALWGLDAEETQEKLPEGYGKLVIGPAGEHLVRYASAASGERMGGRCGAGAVLGSKNLKAVIAFGTMAVGLVEKSCFGAMVALQGSRIVSVPIADAVGALRRVPPDYYLLEVARDLGVSLGEP
jgi:aldehyde:ferredoxin oxidoreductase